MVSFSIKLQTCNCRPATFLKRETESSVFLYFVFQFSRTPLSARSANGCFWRLRAGVSFRKVSGFYFNPNLPRGRKGGCGGGGQIDPSYGFLKNVFSKERVKPWFFVNFNIFLKHIFPEILNKFSVSIS